MVWEKICDIFAESREFHGYLLGVDREEVFIQRSAFCVWVCNSGYIFLQCFHTCGISFPMFDKSIEFFRDREIFIRGVFFFSCNQVFHIVPIGLPTLALNKMLKGLVNLQKHFETHHDLNYSDEKNKMLKTPS